ncbi:efflux RND transporter periplasmic adaptor subunit [Marinifilum caeruleilacunae]|uniref:HlyD family efflux transporter periplasmic adaptor subunit n=1 Tax=Marinifilum caeruleilacunae TaxID=2499076 RepID=A0ABX1WWA0_9BACT|nr:efflux RND transporter periplasmic adaptor subunit [Marinifilum caeruleilacunae]NOU60169.1 HlyD family efflux transporter periplasmic adaptor subunit [Marinifilum caeruleilacunae]
MNKYLFPLLLFIVACGNKHNPDIGLYTVKKGDLQIMLSEEGELKATHSINISSPNVSWRYGNLKIVNIVDDGTEVFKGDTVITFDPSEVGKAIEESKNELEIAKAELEKLKAQHSSKLAELESNLKVSTLSHEISKINFELAEFEAEVTKKEIELKLEKAKISLGKANNEIENTKKMQNEELQQSLLKIEQLKTKLDEGEKALKSLTVISPANGIAILTKNFRTNNKWQIGDQTWSGNPMITLPDLSEIMAKVQINEIDISKILPDQYVEIRLDAYTDTTFKAKVNKIANLAENKDNKTKIKVFPVEALIEGRSAKLLPGMTVSCNIHISKINDKILIPTDALFSKTNQHWVYLKKGSSFIRKDIELGASNNDYVIVEKGLNAKDIIALSNPFPEEEESQKES